MEHLNCTDKFALASQASNLKPRSIHRIGKFCRKVLWIATITQQFDEHSDISYRGGKHVSVSYQKDMERTGHQLHSKTAEFSGCKHRSFSI